MSGARTVSVLNEKSLKYVCIDLDELEMRCDVI